MYILEVIGGQLVHFPPSFYSLVLRSRRLPLLRGDLGQKGMNFQRSNPKVSI